VGEKTSKTIVLLGFFVESEEMRGGIVALAERIIEGVKGAGLDQGEVGFDTSRQADPFRGSGQA
jgi:hypothetical protein